MISRWFFPSVLAGLGLMEMSYRKSPNYRQQNIEQKRSHPTASANLDVVEAHGSSLSSAKTTPPTSERFDYIIVGAGSAGVILKLIFSLLLLFLSSIKSFLGGVSSRSSSRLRLSCPTQRRPHRPGAASGGGLQNNNSNRTPNTGSIRDGLPLQRGAGCDAVLKPHRHGDA